MFALILKTLEGYCSIGDIFEVSFLGESFMGVKKYLIKSGSMQYTYVYENEVLISSSKEKLELARCLL